jgi:hypothetical protein
MPRDSALAHISFVRVVIDRRISRILIWSSIPGFGWLLRRKRWELEGWINALERLLTSWTGSEAEVMELFDLAMAIPMGKQRASQYIRAFFAFKRNVYDAASITMTGAVNDAVGLRVEAVESLRELWKKINAQATSMMQDSRSLFREKAEVLRKELREAGLGDSRPAKTLNELLSVPFENA